MNGQFHNFTRMHSDDYHLLLNLIGPKIARKNTVFSEAISLQERLAVTLRFLATGVCLQYLFKFSKQPISKIVPEVCEAIVEVLKHNIIKKNIKNLLHSLGLVYKSMRGMMTNSIDRDQWLNVTSESRDRI
jgi:hypothetical protein